MHNQSGKIALIDSDWMVYRVGFASEDDDEKYALSRLTELLTDTVYFKLGCDDYEAYLTGKTNFRYGIAKTQPYKGNRKDMKKPKHYEALRQHLMRLGAKMSENCEADDMVAMKMSQFSDYILVGVDKDLLQIPGKHYNPVSDLLFDIDEHTASYNFWTQMLTGDRTDHIPGLAGIGPKKAEKILKDIVNESDMCKMVWHTYQQKGHDYEYFLEQGRLLWLQRYEGEMWEPGVKDLQLNKLERNTDGEAA
jgi:hypothetical protein